MGDGSLSQDEIDALLQGADDMLTPAGGQGAPAGQAGGGGALSSQEHGAIQSVLGSAISMVAPSLSGYLGGNNVQISNPVLEVKPADAFKGEMAEQYVQVSMDYSGAVSGKNLVVFTSNDAGSVSSLMMGDESGAPPAELSDAHQSTIQEFTNQLLSSLATQIGNKMGGGISTTPATLSMASSGNELQLPGGEVLRVTYDFIIDGILSSKLYHFMDVTLGKSMSQGGGQGGQPSQGGGGGQQLQQQPQVGISPVQFPPLDEGIPPQQAGNISLLLDVEMTLTVELGRTKQLVQDILGLGEGSIIELDKLAGEPVDLLVNGKLIAKGEVVVIDENFGVRVTDIVSPADRLSSFQQQ